MSGLSELQKQSLLFFFVKIEFFFTNITMKDISKMKDISNMEDIIAMLNINGKLIKKFETHTEEMCLAAVSNSPWSLRYCKVRTMKICLIALKQDPDVSSIIMDDLFNFDKIENICLKEDVKEYEKKYSDLVNTFTELVEVKDDEIKSLNKYVFDQQKIIDSLDKRLYEKTKELQTITF